MKNKRLLVVGLLGLAAMLVGPKAAQAQSYFYGYYYPEEHRFSSWQLNTMVEDYSTITPMWNATHDRRSGYTFPIVPTNTPMPAAPSFAPSRPTLESSSIRVLVPDSQAVVWFGGYKTKSTGTERVYATPSLTPGSHSYQLKVSYTHDGQQIAQERTIHVTPGQSLVVDFTGTSTASASTATKVTP